MVFFTGSRNALRENLEKRLIFDRAYGKISFWSIEAEPGSLSAGYDKRRNLTLRNQLLPKLTCLVVFPSLVGIAWLIGIKRCRRELVWQLKRCGRQDKLFPPAV